jgi:hypothetical protein
MPSVQLPRPSRIGLVVGAAILFILFLMAGPFRTVPAGNVGIKDFFGSVSSSTLSPGIGLVLPLTSVVRMSVQTQEIKEVAEVPSQEGLILSLETSLLFQLDPAKAVEIYRTVGADYIGIVEPQFRSAIREITASYEPRRSIRPNARRSPGKSSPCSGASPANGASSSSRCCSGRSACRWWSPTRSRKNCGASRKRSR